MKDLIQKTVLPTCLLILFNLASTPILAAGGGKQDLLHTIIYPFINLFIFIGILIYFGKKPLANFLEKRNQDLTNGLKKLEEGHQASEQQLKDIESRYENLQSEIKQIQDDLESNIQSIQDRSKKQIQTLQEKIKSEAEAITKQNIASAKLEIKKTLINEAFSDVYQTLDKEQGKEKDLIPETQILIDKLQ